MAVKNPKTKSEIIAKIAEEAEITKKQAADAYEALLDIIYKGAKSCKIDGDGFTIPGIGKVSKTKRKARWGHNPTTGEKIKIKAKTVLKFKVLKALKDGAGIK